MTEEAFLVEKVEWTDVPNVRMSPTYLPLDFETRTHVSTAAAAYHLGRAKKTLLNWSSNHNGPISPIHVNGRLAWAVADLKKLLKG